jgi:hypothetical protein
MSASTRVRIGAVTLGVLLVGAVSACGGNSGSEKTTATRLPTNSELATQACQQLWHGGPNDTIVMNSGMSESIAAQMPAANRSRSMAARASSGDATYAQLAHDLNVNAMFTEGLAMGGRPSAAGQPTAVDETQALANLGIECGRLLAGKGIVAPAPREGGGGGEHG